MDWLLKLGTTSIAAFWLLRAPKCFPLWRHRCYSCTIVMSWRTMVSWQIAITHVPWFMLGALTRGFIWSRWRGKRSQHSRLIRDPQFYVSCKMPIACSIQAVYGTPLKLWSNRGMHDKSEYVGDCKQILHRDSVNIELSFSLTPY